MNKLRERLSFLFIPREENNFRAKVLHHDFLTVYLVFAFVLVFFVKNFSNQLSNVLGFATDISTDRLYQLTNDERAKNGLPPLTYNGQLAQAAAAKAQDMFAKNYWAHFGPSGESPWGFISGAGYSYQVAGENLAKNFLFSQNVMDGWMASSSHRENILRGDFSDVGFAVANGVLNGEETTLVVQIFGRLQGGAIAQAPPPQTTTQTQPVVQKVETTPSPQATTAPVKQVPQTKPLVLVASKPNQTPSIAPFSFNISSVFIMFLIFALALDFYFAQRLKIVRLHGKTYAHFIFLFAMLAGLFLFLSKGSIL